MGFFLYNVTAETRADEPDIEILGLRKTFHNLAILDANAAMEVWASKDVVKKWKQEAGPVLGDPLRSGAFFSSAMTLPSSKNQNTWIAAYFNPWINALLMLKIERPVKALQITDFDLVLPHGTADLSPGMSGDALSALLSRRFEIAQKDFLAEAGSWSGSKMRKNRPNEWRLLNEELQLNIREMRGTLSWEGDPAKEKLRVAFSQVTSALHGGKEDVGLSTSKSEPAEWRASLHPVYLDEKGNKPVIVMFSNDYPTRFLWIQLDPTAKKPVVAEQVLTIEPTTGK